MSEGTRPAGSSDSGAGAERRVWAALPAVTQPLLEHGLSRTDLQTLLLAVARVRSSATTPAQLMRRWHEDRFVRPATTDPRRLARLELRLWELLPPHVVGVALSPVAPLGTSSALGPVSQNRVLSTTRLTEVVSDSTNALAIEAASRRLRQHRSQAVHLAAVHQVLRTQAFPPGYSAHFRLFSLVSSARDTGGAGTEAALLQTHLRYWRDVLLDLLPAAAPRVELTVFDSAALRERAHDTVLPALDQDGEPSIVVEDPQRERGRGYYQAAALRISAQGGDRRVELGDGGFTSWTAQLSGNAKERCLISCLATERLTDLVDSQPPP